MILRLALLLAVLVALHGLPSEAQPIRPLPFVAGQADTVHVADLVVTHEPVSVASTGVASVTFVPELGIAVIRPEDDFEGLAVIPLKVGDEALGIPIRVRRLIPHVFTYPAGDAGAVSVFGQFNDWSRTSHPLERQPDGIWTVTVDLDPGRYEYKFTVDGVEVLDPANPDQVPNPFGDYNNVLEIPPRHAEVLVLHVVGFEEGEVEFAFERDGRPAMVEGLDVVALLENAVIPRESVRTDGDRVLVRVDSLDTGTLRVAVSGGGRSTRMAVVHLEDGQPLDGLRFSWRDAILYQIMVDRFHDGDPGNTMPVAHDSVSARANFHGGDLQGILDRLRQGYFDQLGVNTLWLSPVVQNTDRAHREYPPPHRWYTGYHGYWPVHPNRVDPRFGDMDLLRRLVDEARGRGIHVLLDFVANHTHEDHPFFREHRDWFGTLELPDGRLNLRLWDEHRLTTWFEPYLPSFDYERSDEAVEAMIENAVWWLRESGAAGFRHDAVKHIPGRFWRALTARIRHDVEAERGARVFQIGETFGSHDLISSYVLPGQLDSQFNFNLYDAALHVFLNPDSRFQTLDAEMSRTLDLYGEDHLMGNLMDSHDKPRFPALVEGHVPGPDGDDKEIGWERHVTVEDLATYRTVELYLAYLLTTPGIPTIYYGNEIGKTGANDPDNRRPMRFGEDLTPDEREFRRRVERLIGLRRDLPPLRRGGFHSLHAGNDIWAYLRADVGGRVVVGLNKGETNRPLKVAIPAALATNGATDALTGQAIDIPDGTLSFVVPGRGYRVLVLGAPLITPP